MPSAAVAARIFAALTGLVCLFQLALALGAPWGRFAMGGAFPGTFPPAMRVAAVAQIAVLMAVALVVLARAGMALPPWRAASRWLIWIVVALLGVAATFNLITPSGPERMVWAPVAGLMLLASLRVALSA